MAAGMGSKREGEGYGWAPHRIQTNLALALAKSNNNRGTRDNFSIPAPLPGCQIDRLDPPRPR